MDEVTL